MATLNLVSLHWLLFFTATIVGYWSVPSAWRDLFSAIAGGVLILLHSTASLIMLSLLTAVLLMFAPPGRALGERSLFALLAGALLALSVARINSALGPQNENLFTAAIGPLGLSYYVLRYAHYVIERYKGTIEQHSRRQIVTYMFFVPTLFVGPVNRFPEYLRETRRLRWNSQRFSIGLERVLYGYVKIVVLGNFLMGEFAVDAIAEWTGHGAFRIYCECIRNGVYAFLLIAGYSDVAIGFSLLLGCKVPENFNRPFLARNISEFWRSWHISVSSWFREYVYVGSLAIFRSPLLALFIAMAAFALWHEFSLRFLAWGLYNAVGIVSWRIFSKACDLVRPLFAINLLPTRVLPVLSIVITIHFFMFGLVLITEPTLDAALRTFGVLLGLER